MQYLNFSWILEGSLAGAQGPTRSRDLVFLNLHDIRAIVRMEERTISGEAMELVDLYEPVPDFTPPRLDQIDRMVTFIQTQTEKWERPVVVTCQAGLGRTGTVLACYLVQTGYSASNAVDLVRELRPQSIQTREQEDMVHQYAGILKDRERERKRQALRALEEL